MPTLSDGRFFSATSPLPEYTKEMAKADDAADVVDFVTLVRGMCETHWHRERPDSIAVSQKMHDAMVDRLNRDDRAGVGYSLHSEGQSVSVARIPVTVKE